MSWKFGMGMASAVLVMSAVTPGLATAQGLGDLLRGGTRAESARADVTRERPGVQVVAVGRVQEAPTGGVSLTLEANNMTFTVNLANPRFTERAAWRKGDLVRVVGELVERNRIQATEVKVLDSRGDNVGGGGDGDASRTRLTGKVRGLNRETGEFNLNTGTGEPTRVRIGERTEIFRGTEKVGRGQLQAGDEVRVIGVRRERMLNAQRIEIGPAAAGWSNGAIGEIVSINARNNEMEVDFGGQTWVVKIQNARLRRNEQRAELSDFRVGRDVRVFGTSSRARTVEANLIEGAGGEREGNRENGREGRKF